MIASQNEKRLQARGVQAFKLAVLLETGRRDVIQRGLNR